MSTTRGQHLIGQEIGSCILEKLLGYGGSSAVFLAQSLSSEEKVAVKVFLQRSTMDKQTQRSFYRRFLREAEAASELDHPNIMSIYSYGEHNGLPYIVMPYMPGGTLSEYVLKYGPLSLNEAQEYLRQISSALDYAHAHRCVHCDVKPANILLDGSGHVVLSDFGIVRLAQPDSEITQESLKSSEILMGTPDYISPEQALGEELDGRSDIYSLAVTLFFLLTGTPPFRADSSIAMALMHVHEPPPALGTMRVDSTPRIDRVIDKALSKWPEDRFQTAGEFSEAFAEAVAGDYDFSESGAKRKANGTSRGGKQAAAALKPVVQIKPARKGLFKLHRVVLSLVLLLAVIAGSVITVNVVGTLRHSQPTPTASPAPTDYLADQQSEWPQGRPIFFFDKNGKYHIQNTSPVGIAIALYGSGSGFGSGSRRYTFTDFSLTVTTSEIHGSQDPAGDYYGIVFRSSSDQLHYYLFEISAWDGGQYEFLRYDGLTSNGQTSWQYLASGPVSSSSFSPNFGQRNVITAEAIGNTFTFKVNGQSVKVTDTSKQALSSGGYIGLSVEGQGTEVAFSHLQINPLGALPSGTMQTSEEPSVLQNN